MVKKNNIIIPFLLLVFLYVFFGKVDKLPIEELAIPAGIGTDTYKAVGSETILSIPLCVYVYNEEGISSKVVVGKGLSIVSSREDRALKQDKKFLLGLEKVYVISKDYAKEGLRDSVDILFRNPSINDTSYMLVCEGSAEEILKLKISQYPSSSDYIDGLMKSIGDEYFFSDDFHILDLYVRLDSVGRTIVLPYIKIEEGKPRISGMAYFKDDKMVGVLDIQDCKFLNILRKEGKKGIFSMKNSKNEDIAYDCSVKRKVLCTKTKEGYDFTIKLAFKGNIIADESNLKINEKPKDLALIQDELASSIKVSCEDFIKKMQEEYKVDLLELGRVAAAKYGRGSNYKNIVENSKIKVEVDVKIDNQGRGNY